MVCAMTATDSSRALAISMWSLNSSTVMPDDLGAETFFTGSTTTGAEDATGSSTTADGAEIASSLN